jgi:hypothetical protein
MCLLREGRSQPYPVDLESPGSLPIGKLTLRPHCEYPTASRVLHQRSVWYPLPETTRQLLCSLLLLWTESSWTTSSTIVVPRILIRQWSRVSKAATVYPRDDYPHCYSLALPS